MVDGQKENLLALFLDISKGYTKYNISDIDIYIKHLDKADHNKFSNWYQKKIQEAIADGILLEGEQIRGLYDLGWWSKEKEQEIESLEITLLRLEKTRSKLIYQSDKERIDQQIKDVNERYEKINNEKHTYITITAEQVATKKSLDFFLTNFLYSDEDLKFLFFNSVDDFEYRDDEFMLELAYMYSRYMNEHSDIKIKRTAISTMFQNLLYASSGSCMDIFGKPAVDLTKYQLDLLMLGKYYRDIIKNCTEEIPEKILDNPDKLFEWYKSISSQSDQSALTRSKSKNGESSAGSTFLFGTREEVKSMAGGSIGGDKMIDETARKGGMGIYDLLNK